MRIRCPACGLVQAAWATYGQRPCTDCGRVLRWGSPPEHTPPGVPRVVTTTSAPEAPAPEAPTTRPAPPRDTAADRPRPALAVALRRAWFEHVAPALDEEYPGAAEVLLFAHADLDTGPTLKVRIPAEWPLAKPVHGVVRRKVTELCRAAAPRGGDGLAVRVTFAGTGRVTRGRGEPTGLEVVRPGDPHPSMWPEFERQLDGVVAGLAPTTRDVVRVARPVAFSRRAVWLEWPSRASHAALGSTSGAAYALLRAVQAWDRDCRPVHVVPE